ncbi:GGDEF domain-containing protein [Lacipirellula sp.]|uniref:GGDEF domain-containing protein n=1 Tax=Lacipirellula sp. TaxID=2691419 RepID=UPI003D13BBC8
MNLLLAVTVARVASDVALAFAAFFVGFCGAVIYMRFIAARHAAPAIPSETASGEMSANDAARASMAAQQLRDLARNVAYDVGAHNSFVESITDQLEEIEQGGAGGGAVVMDVVAKMLDANKRLQTRLEDAEQKIATQAEEIRNQQFEARTDALTRLANRRAFDAALLESTELFASKGQSFALIMLDVDNFKQFNDVHGHPAGDEVLRTVGRTLGRVVNPGDLACRYGGEEFAVILANVTLDDGQLAAERIRKAIEAMNVQFGGNALRVTASVGVAGCFSEEETAALVRRADEAVYGAKKNGRNCAFWHDREIARLILAAKTAEPAAKTPAATEVKKFPNRAIFTDELHRRIAESRRFGVPITLVHFRVREFAELEHNYGNAVGMLLIDSLASFVQSTLRDMDLLARLEGGELIVMLPGSSASAAKIVGQRVRTSISLCPVPLGDHQIRLELDMGVSSVQPGEDATGAMESARADLDATAAAEAQQRLQEADLAAV